MSGLTKENISKISKNSNNNNKIPALLDVRIKESQKRLAEAHEAIAKEAVAHRASEEAKAKKALDDSLAKKAWENNNKKVNEKEGTSNEAKLLDSSILPTKNSNIPEINPEGPELEGLDFTIKSYLAEGPNREKSKRLVKAFRRLQDETIQALTGRNPDFAKALCRAMKDSAESEEEPSSSDSDSEIRIETKKKRKARATRKLIVDSGDDKKHKPDAPSSSSKDLKLLEMFEEKYHRSWMYCFRPAEMQKKTDKFNLYDPKNLMECVEDLDPLPDRPVGSETKILTKNEFDRMSVYVKTPRERRISPEFQYSRKGLTFPDLELVQEPPSMGNWRNTFYPENHLGLGYSPVHKLLSFRQKEAKLQRQSLLPNGGDLRLSYEHSVLITARRLIKSGRDPNQGSPERQLFEDFKE